MPKNEEVFHFLKSIGLPVIELHWKVMYILREYLF